MANYYYLISSLPTLSTDSVVITYDKFLELCKGSVNEGTFKQLNELSLKATESFKGCSVVREFGAFYSALMNELCYQRNLKLGKNSQRSFDFDSDICNIVDSALKATNPLETENLLLKAQFEYTDNLCRMHYFDDYVLFSYAVKIKLIERKLIFDHEMGKNEFNRLFDGIQRQISNI